MPVLKVSKDRGTLRLWIPVIAWLILAGGLVGAFGHNFAEMWIRWFPAWHYKNMSLYDRLIEGESYYTHGPLIPAVSFVIFLLIIRHIKIPVRPRAITGLIVLIISLVIHLAACLARVNFVSGFAFIGVLSGLILILWGNEALKRLWFPIVFLIFMVPLPEVTIAQLNFRLKMLAANVGVDLANAIGIVAERTGNRVLLEGDKSVIIANVCNGLRTLISLLAFGAIYVYVCRLRGVWRIVLFIATVPVAVISNSIRIVSLIAVADIWNVQIASGWYHDFSGLLIFILAFLMMFALERFIFWVHRILKRPIKVVPLFRNVQHTERSETSNRGLAKSINSLRGWLAVMAIVISALVAWWLNRSIPPVWNQQMASQAVPIELEVEGNRMVGYSREMDDRTLAILETRDYMSRRYVAAGLPYIDLCVIFSMDNRKGTHPPDLCLEGSGEGIIAKRDIDVNGVPGRGIVSCRELIVQANRRKEYFLYTYKCGDTYTRSFWRQQFTIFINGLLNRNASGALIEISTPIVISREEAYKRAQSMLRAVIPYLDRGLP
ncbi:MAG: EpsI family protein [Planctomycetes bacterium]|nr:EpsI family protein [Planctomycetota bacterium]